MLLEMAVMLCGTMSAEQSTEPKSSGTEIVDLIHSRDGHSVAGKIFVSWNSFVTNNGVIVSGGQVSVRIEVGGGCSTYVIAKLGIETYRQLLHRHLPP